MVITEIKRVKRRYLILAGGQRYVLTSAQLRERPMKPGDEIDQEELDDWLLKRQFRSALEYSGTLLSGRAYARGELEQKLLRCGYRPSTVELVLYKLDKYELLDDADFAAQWTRARARKHGPRRIMQELRQKGVSREDAEAAFSELNPEDIQSTADTAARKALARHRRLFR